MRRRIRKQNEMGKNRGGGLCPFVSISLRRFRRRKVFARKKECTCVCRGKSYKQTGLVIKMETRTISVRHCKRCNGHGGRTDDGVWYDCLDCGGTGHIFKEVST